MLPWFSVGFWNFIKPLPPGTHVTSLTARLAESQVDFLYDSPQHGQILASELDAIDRAELMIVLDQCPLARELAQHLLARKHVRPNLKIVFNTDPRNEVYGGTPVQHLATLERAGIIVARTRLDRLRDSDPLYSGLWRSSVGWWSNPYDDASGRVTPAAWLRHLNANANQRQLLVADDGAGGWTSIVTSESPSEPGRGGSNVGLEVRARLARDLAVSELEIAAWSTDDDRLPGPPPLESRGVGSVDARLQTEGAIRSGLLDAIGGTLKDDEISMVAGTLSDRQVVEALLGAASRQVRIHVLLDPDSSPDRVVAGELLGAGAGAIEIRWIAVHDPPSHARLALVRHRTDLWLNVGSADFTRRSLGDFNLDANIELRMPAGAAPARAAADYFTALWLNAATSSSYVDRSSAAYWRYRFAEVTGLTTE